MAVLVSLVRFCVPMPGVIIPFTDFNGDKKANLVVANAKSNNIGALCNS